MIMANIELEPGASMDRTYVVAREFQAQAQKVAGVENVTIVTGRSFLGGAGSNGAQGMIRLKPFDQRTSSTESMNAIIAELTKISKQITDARMVFMTPPSVPGFGASGGFEFVLLDRAGGTIDDLNNTAQQFIAALSQRPEIQYAQTSFNTRFPQYEMTINTPKAMEDGVSVANILSVMQGYIGGIYASDFNLYGKQFRVMVQALPEFRKNPSDLNGLFVKTASGAMTPITQYVSMKTAFGPQTISRYNLFTSVKISGANDPAYSTGDAIAAVEEVASQNLSTNYDIEFTGLTREEIKSGSQTLLVFLLSFVFVYFILAAQYESYILPLSVLCSLPFGVMGAYMGQWIMGLENNIYFQIALIMLVGLLAKNAILIVEFAVHHRRQGQTILMSAVHAARERLRPILMTSFAFIFGMVPLVFASGIGSVGNRSIGTGAAFGLLAGTIVGLLIIPILYIFFQSIQEKISPMKFEKK
jgi:HAE1 family hydrophobic/amphiphilic exporter-1